MSSKHRQPTLTKVESHRSQANRLQRDAGGRVSSGEGILRTPSRSEDPNQLVSFGTSGHRGSPRGTFTEAHILAITQAICDYRPSRDQRSALHGEGHSRASGPAQQTALEVLAANDVETIIQQGEGVTPTPVISRAILVYNRGRKEHLADGIVITPRTIRRRMEASSTTPPTAALRIPM